VNDTAAVVFLGVIAVAVFVMALLQVGAVVYAARLARRAEGLLTRLEHDIQPAIARVTALTGDAARAAALAASQVERADRLLDEITVRADRAFTSVQRAIGTPQREATALVAGVRAAVGALRGARQARRRRSGFDEDDALFIG